MVKLPGCPSVGASSCSWPTTTKKKKLDKDQKFKWPNPPIMTVKSWNERWSEIAFVLRF